MTFRACIYELLRHKRKGKCFEDAACQICGK